MFLGRTGFFDPAQKEGTRSTSDILIQPEKGELQSPEKSLITKEFSRSSLEQRILAEWRMILDQIEISPQIVAGQPRGFKLTKLPEKSLLSEIGFQRDDIILDLNGEELKDKAFIISLIDRFKNDDRGQITIERCGRQITFELVLK